MAEINERASTSIECPLSPTSPTTAATTLNEEMRAQTANSFEKISAYVQGAVEGEASARVSRRSDELTSRQMTIATFSASVDDYKTLADLNDATAQRYRDMHSVAERITNRLDEMNVKCESNDRDDGERREKMRFIDESLRPYLAQIDQIDDTSKRLDETISTLENYITTLESRLKKACATATPPSVVSSAPAAQ